MHYNTSFVNNTPKYNGDITAISWTASGDNQRTYSFKYDGLSRLIHAAYNNVASGGLYNTSYEYDKHGNITNLVRRGKKDKGNAASSYDVVDKLDMQYIGNQLKNIADAGVNITMSESQDFKDYQKGTNIEYTFNKNGAMTKDLNKGITNIQYNSLNLPVAIEIASPHAKGRTKYWYSITGTKLKTIHETDPVTIGSPLVAAVSYNTKTTYTTTTDYVGNKIYEDGQLKRILIEGGYIDNTDKKYHFFQTDHLGNNRVVADQNGTVIQKNHYYPFGMTFAEGTIEEQGKQPYKYNGKEEDTRHGLNLIDYSARHYDNQIGRFTAVDPLAEKYYSISPYVYCYNNPLKYIDPDGRNPRLALRLRSIPKMYKAYKTARTVEGLGVAASISAAFSANQLSGDATSEEVANHLMNVANSVTTTQVTSELNKNIPPDPRWAREQEKNAKNALDGAQAVVAKAINDNISGKLPSGDPAPKRPPKGIGKIVIGAGLLGELVRSIFDPLGSAKDKSKPKQPEPKETEPPKSDPKDDKKDKK